MKKFIVFIFIFIFAFNTTYAHEFADAKPLPQGFKKLDLRDRIIAIARSQVGYEQAYNGSTIYHYQMFPNIKRTDYKYDAPWNTIFFAWVFSYANIYTNTFQNYSSLSKETLKNRFITAGKVNDELAYAYFDSSYINNIKPGDLVFFDRFKKFEDDYSDLSEKHKVNQISLATYHNDGVITVLSPYYMKKVWEGDLNTKYKLHSPYKIMGVGVLDCQPTKEIDENIKTPLLAYEESSGKQMVIYYIYKDGTALTSNGERNISDFISNSSVKYTKMTRKMRSNMYTTSTSDVSIGTLPDMTEIKVLSDEGSRAQIVVPWNLYDGKSKFPIDIVVWIDNFNK